MKGKLFRINRIFVTLALMIAAMAYFELRVKPQSRPLYERSLALYRQQKYEASLNEANKAYRIEPNSTAILVLQGWDLLKLRRFEESKEAFGRASRLDPSLVDAQLGLSYAALETGGGQASLVGARALLAQDPKNADFQLAAASAAREVGSNQEAQQLFARLLDNSRYGQLARKNLEEMYGIEGLNLSIPQGLPPFERPKQLRDDFHADNRFLQRRNGSSWENVYLKGVDLGPATPGHFVSEAPNTVSDYAGWLKQVSTLGANVVRVYSILPPAFYRALKQYNDGAGASRLYLIQQVWLIGPEDNNFFAPNVEEVSRQEIGHAIDVIHGQGDVPRQRGHASGLYVVDVSDYTIGLLIGRELEPHLVQTNNALNSFRKNYSGKYISIDNGNATETWLAQMLDYAAGYEVDKYNTQRPLAIANWPPLDPLRHPTEAGLAEEMSFRRKMGEKVGPLPDHFDDDDAVSVDEMLFRKQGAFQAGLFVSYSAFPFYPEFLSHEPALLQVRDSEGPNSYFGYLKALKQHYSQMPLLITEYGIPTSIGIAHIQPNGLNQGGLNERQQGEALARMTGNIADAGCAGGLLLEWQDEWHKSNWMTRPFEIPEDRRPLWLDVLNPQQTFGLLAYDPSKSRLFSPDVSAWQGVKPIYEKTRGGPAAALNDGADGARTLRGLSVSSDEAYVYVRLAVQSLPRAPAGRQTGGSKTEGTPQLDAVNYLIGISTRPGSVGSRLVPGFKPFVKTPAGMNFLLHVEGGGNAHLLVASNYNPYGNLPVEGVPGRVYLGLHRPWQPALEDWSSFEEMEVEANRLHFSRDGTPYPAQRYSRSLLRYGPLDRNSPQYDSLATWSANFQSNALIFRIPWGLLFVTDPSSRQVYGGTSPSGQPFAVGTPGLAFFALSFRPSGGPPNWSRYPTAPLGVTDSLPGANPEGVLPVLQRYTWEGWNAVQLAGRLKAGVPSVQKSFKEVKAKTQAFGAPVSRPEILAATKVGSAGWSRGGQ